MRSKSGKNIPNPLGYAPSFTYGIGALEIITTLGLIAGFRWRRLAAGSALELAVILIDVIVSHLAANAAADAVLPAVDLGRSGLARSVAVPLVRQRIRVEAIPPWAAQQIPGPKKTLTANERHMT
jgi:hypothetical protein